MQVTPRPWIGITVFLLYLAAFYGTWITTGIDYNRIGESITTILTWYVLPLAVGAVVLIVAASVLGWWRPSLYDTNRGPAWLWIAPRGDDRHQRGVPDSERLLRRDRRAVRSGRVRQPASGVGVSVTGRRPTVRQQHATPGYPGGGETSYCS